MKIAVAGTGYVGLSIATLLSQHHEVTIKESMHLLNDLVSQGIRACICHHNMRFAGVSVTNRKNLRWRLLKCRKHETIWQKW